MRYMLFFTDGTEDMYLVKNRVFLLYIPIIAHFRAKVNNFGLEIYGF